MIASASCITVIYTVIELHGLIPVVTARMVIKPVVSCSSGWALGIRFINLGIFRRKSLELWFGITDFIQIQIAPCIIEIIPGREVHVRIIIFSQIPYTCWFANGMILSGYMVRNEIHNYFHTCLVSTLYQLLPLFHSHTDIHSQVWIDIIVVGNSIWRTCFSLHYLCMLSRNSIRRVVCLSGMTNHTRIPNMCKSHIVDACQNFIREIIQLSATILFDGTIFLTGCILVSEESWENLVYNNFFLHLAALLKK